MSAELKDADSRLAEIKARLGTDLNDIAFFFLLKILTLPFAASFFSKLPRDGLKHTSTTSVKFLRLLLDEKCDKELKAFLLAANRAHESLSIPSHVLRGSLAAVAISIHDWLVRNTTIELRPEEEQAILDAFSNVRKLMNLGDSPQSFEEYRAEFESCTDANFCPLAKMVMHKGIGLYKEVQGWKRLILVAFLYPSSLTLKSKVVLGIPHLPAPICSVVQRTLRVRWLIHDLLSPIPLSK